MYARVPAVLMRLDTNRFALRWPISPETGRLLEPIPSHRRCVATTSGDFGIDNIEAKDDEDDAKPGDFVSFRYDQMTVEQFRARFPHARWSDNRKAWFVSGVYAHSARLRSFKLIAEAGRSINAPNVVSA